MKLGLKINISYFKRLLNKVSSFFTNTYSLDFDGVDDFVQCGDVWNLSTNNWSPFTLSFWIKASNPIVGAVHIKNLFGFAITGSGPFIYDGYLGAANVRLYMFGYGVYWTVGSNGTVDLFDDQWHNVVMILPAGSNAGIDTTSAKLYIDNTLITTGAQGTATEPAAYYKWRRLFINVPGSGNLQCKIDEVALWKTDESSSVENIYNLGTPNDLSLLANPPVVWYRNGDNGTYKSPQWLIPSNENKDKVSNYSFEFDGVGDKVLIPPPPSLNNTTEFTVSMWFKATSLVGQRTIWSMGSSGSQLWGVSIYVGSFYIYAGSSTKYIIRPHSLVEGTWYNLVLVYDGSLLNADKCKAYLDGTLLTEGSEVGTIPTVTPTFTTDFKIGGLAYSTVTAYVGNVDEFAIFDRVVTPAEIVTLSTAPTVDLTSLNPTNWYRNGDNGAYKSPQWLIPNNENKDKVSNYSFEFDGVDDYIDFGNPTDLQITTDLSVSFWFKGSSTANQAIVAKDTFGLRCWGIWNNVFGAGNNLQFYIFNSNSLTEVQTSANYNDGNWHNVVCVFKPSTYLRIYVDGVLDGENTTLIPATIDNDAANLTVGSIVSSGIPVYEFEGNVDEVAIFNTDQSANISSLYNSGTPTTISGAVAHYKMGEQATFSGGVWTVPDSAGSNNGTSNGMTIEDRIGEAPNSENNALSFNMDEVDRTTDVPT